MTGDEWTLEKRKTEGEEQRAEGEEQRAESIGQRDGGTELS